jgi:DNA-directed RNA polymerase specialized sigma24 family protein
MQSTVTQLDRMLYGWLAERDERRFDQAFERYYAVASTQVVRYLSRRSSLPDLDCEQIAVDALLKFFGRVGRERRRAVQSIGDAVAALEPLNLGPLHDRQVRRWSGEVGSFSRLCTNFVVQPDDTDPALKAAIQAVNDQISPLQRQGWHFLESARTAVADVADVADVASDADASVADTEANSDFAIIRRFAVALRDAVASDRPSAAESKCPGVARFVAGTSTIVDSLPLLRVPTNGYLFDIAHSLYLDECKARGRRKRGGSGYAGSPGTVSPGSLSSLVDLDESGWPEEEGEGSPWAAASTLSVDPLSAEPGVDPAVAQLHEDFFERFHAYLRRPVAEAEEAYREAALHGRAEAARRRLESVGRKNERLLAVLTMRIEGQTQEAIAEALEISRNQVKYIVEQVQSAYGQFCALAQRNART